MSTRGSELSAVIVKMYSKAATTIHSDGQLLFRIKLPRAPLAFREKETRRDPAESSAIRGLVTVAVGLKIFCVYGIREHGRHS